MTVRQFLDIVEIRTKVVGISTFLLGTLYAFSVEDSFDPVLFVLMTAAVLSVDMGTTAFNTFFDFLRGTDDRAFNRERDKVLVHEGVSPAAALAVALALYLFAAFMGLAVAHFTGPFVAAAGVCGLAVGFFYTGGPFPISRTPFGELFAGGFLGTVLFVVSFYVQAGYLTAGTAAASLPLFFLISGILTVNNTCDMEGDAASGRKTLSLLVGKKVSQVLILAFILSAHVSVGILSVAGLLPGSAAAGAVISLVFAVRESIRMVGRGFSHETKGVSMKSIASVFSVFSLALLVSIAAGLLL